MLSFVSWLVVGVYPTAPERIDFEVTQLFKRINAAHVMVKILKL